MALQRNAQHNTNKNNKLITRDIKELHTNLPKTGITMATRHWLQQSTIDHEERIKSYY